MQSECGLWLGSAVKKKKNPEGTSRPTDRKGLQVGHCCLSGSLCSGNTAAVQLCVVQDEGPASRANF